MTKKMMTVEVKKIQKKMKTLMHLSRGKRPRLLKTRRKMNAE